MITKDCEDYKKMLDFEALYFQEKTLSLQDIQNCSVLPWAYDPIGYSAADRWIYELTLEKVYKIFELKILSKFNRKVRIIDLGCGPGGSALWFAMRGYSVLGIDNNQKRIEAAKYIAQKYKAQIKKAGGSLSYLCSNFFDIYPRPIDVLISFWTFHHVPSCQKLLEKYLNYLPKNGIFMIFDQAGNSDFSNVASGICSALLPPGTCKTPWLERQKAALYKILVGTGFKQKEKELNPLEGIGNEEIISVFQKLFTKIQMMKTDPLRLLPAVQAAKPKSKSWFIPLIWINEICKKFVLGKDLYIIADCENLQNTKIKLGDYNEMQNLQ